MSGSELRLDVSEPQSQAGTIKNLRGGGGMGRKKYHYPGASLVAQWLGVHLPVQGTWVRSLVQEDPTCCGATGPVHRNC